MIRKYNIRMLHKYINEEARVHIIRSALADDIPFETIQLEFGLTENEVVQFMKAQLPLKKFILWRNRARGSSLKNVKRARAMKYTHPNGRD